MKNPTAPTGGEYGTAPGVWTLEQVMNYQRAGTWPSPVTPKMLWSWGLNTYGQLGLSDTINRSFVSQVGVDQNWKAIAQGLSSSLAVKSDGTLWAWGDNSAGQLGQNNLIYRSSPVQVGSLTTWSFVGASRSSASFAVKTDGTLWSWGSSYYGQLGNGSTAYNFSSPIQIGALTNWSKVYGSGLASIFAIKTDGTLWVWGRNSDGTLGLGNTTSYSSPKQVGALTNWSKISAGIDFTTSIKTDGSIWSWGKNGNGQLGQNVSYSTTRNSPVQIGALTTWSTTASYGGGVNIATKTDGTLWSWGNNNAGQLGQNDTVKRSSPVQVGALSNWSSVGNHNQTSMAINSSGQLWMWGGASSGRIADGSNVNKSSPVQVASNIFWNKVGFCGSQASFTLATGKPLSLELWGWGFGTQIGDNTTANRSSPVQVGSDINWVQISSATSTMAIKSDNTLWGWGFNNAGQIGDGTTINRSSPIQIGSLTNWKQVSSGGSQFSLAVKTNGTLWSWGSGYKGVLGKGNNYNYSSPVQVGALTNWSFVSASDGSNVAAIKTDNSLWTWGYNNYGQLGVGNEITRSSPVQVAGTFWSKVSCGGGQVLAIRTNGTLWSWGKDRFGELGQNTTFTPKSSPTQVGALTNWAQIAACGGSSFAIKIDGTLWAWGRNVEGQLGLNDATNRPSPVQVGTLSDWSKISGGTAHTIALKTNGTLWSWGYNEFGQLGNNTAGIASTTSSPTQIGSSTSWWFVSNGNSSTSFALKQNSSIQPAITVQPTGGSVTEEGSFTFTVTATGAWGYQWYFAGAPIAGATSYSYTVTGAVGANTGNYYVVVYNGNGSVQSNTVTLTVNIPQGGLWAWGRNYAGSLGLDSITGNMSSPVQVGALTTWKTGVGVAQYTGVGVKSDGTLWSWGANSTGQLGQSNTYNTSSPVQVGALTTWKQAVANVNSMFAIKTDGTLWAWGRNNQGQLGNGNKLNASSPIQIGALTNWKQVGTAGRNFTLAVKTDGTLWGWGSGDNAQTGHNNTTYYSSPVQIGSATNWNFVAGGYKFGIATTSTGTLWAWGNNADGQLGDGTYINRSSPVQVGSLTTWNKVVCGMGHVVSTQTNGNLFTWGRNDQGQLGLGNTTNYSSPMQVGSGTTWSTVGALDYTSFSVKTDGTLWSWGLNNNGQLGQNTTTKTSSPAQVGSGTTWIGVASNPKGRFTTGIKT